MQVTVFGASGNVGQLVVDRAQARGHTVVAFIHSHSPFRAAQGLRIVQGSIDDAAAVARALTGSTAVISTLGSWHTPHKDVLTKGMQTILPLMKQQGIRRIVTLTGSGAFDAADRLSPFQKVLHSLFKVLAPKILEDGEAHMRLLRASGLDWTTVRSPVMTNRGTIKYRLGLSIPLPIWTIHRQAVAQALVDQLEDKNFLRQAPNARRGSG